MSVIEYIKELFTTPSFVIIGAITLFEISPIKINPWSALLKWIGKTINSETQERLIHLSESVKELRSEFEAKNVSDTRWEILSFANSCRRGVKHSKDEWWHTLTQIAEYEKYCELKGIENGVIEEDSLYLRELYHERNMKNDFFSGGKTNE